MMKPTLKAALIIIACGLVLAGCRRGAQNPQPVAASTPPTVTEAVPITLPVLDALFADETFRAELKSKLQLSDEQINALKKVSSDEVARLRKANAENQAGSAEASRNTANESIRAVLGSEKTEQLLALAREHWSKGSDEPGTTAAAKDAEPTMLKGPNAVPKDTRVVVNIPAVRMDVFADGVLVKSYKVGIGYPEFPLPQGLRKAQLIIFNPTWTPPDSPWVDSMKVTPGEVIEAGSKQNPLGPIKIPIGSPSLIHGGKSPAKIGTFASHGCVGMTNAQVKDFAKVLAQASNTGLSEETMSAYLKNRTKTRVVKLNKLVPVELRYETIVVEDGKLHIYRDVYDQNTNTEDNLRAVLEANGVNFDDLNTEDKAHMLEAVNALSRRPKKQPTPKATIATPPRSADTSAVANERKAEAERQKKLRGQKEIVIAVATLIGKGYPAPVKLDSGAGTQAIAATAPALNKH
jgi:lipoprotein-anchoring transpeptidase ErfK/SrfK/ribosomal protein L12E/L44/L45/RPP1/RPP2